MARMLTAHDVEQLRGYKEKEDRYKYWSYLANKGDSYARMALNVVTGSTLDGYVANHYAASYADGDLADTESTQAWWPVGSALMG